MYIRTFSCVCEQLVRIYSLYEFEFVPYISVQKYELFLTPPTFCTFILNKYKKYGI